MAMENQNRVVMGFPAEYFETPPRYEEPTIVNTTPEPLPCNNPGKNLHPCLKWLILTPIVTFMLFILLAFSAFYLTYQNRVPIIRIESITPSIIASLNNTSFSINWHLTLFLENPNKFSSIHYKKIRVSVFDRHDQRLSSSYVDNFDQDKGERGRLNTEIFGLVLDLEKEKINEAGEMVFSLKLDAVVRVKTKYMNNHWQLLEANCGDVKVRPSMSLNLDGSGRCNVNLQ